MMSSQQNPTSASADLDLRIPTHIAVIMDGNGRWASRLDKPRVFGHQQGVQSVIDITRACSGLGVKYLTLYGFSTENWRRPQQEVDLLMHLIGTTVEQQTPFLIENNVRLNIIGELERIPSASRSKLINSLAATSTCTGMVLTMALSYSGRWDLTSATRLIAHQVAQGSLNPDDINSDTLSSALSTAQLPDPDLLIRTGGEYRISNFLLWDIAYTEMYFTHTLWPDFDPQELLKAIDEYSHRERRFGKTSQQVGAK